ncbi:hypothetical protein FQV30_10170 [Planomicrobium sp. CPCC 101110]|nr:hypothetical protein FQV30_10170 [Planomicrobium sp. CPCC 101110]
MLSLAMVFLLFGSLLPVLQGMHEKLQLKRERATAFETMFEGAVQMQSESALRGMRTVNGTVYHWQMERHMCVSYDNYQGEPQVICLE